jgi:hypothetical protein
MPTPDGAPRPPKQAKPKQNLLYSFDRSPWGALARTALFGPLLGRQWCKGDVRAPLLPSQVADTLVGRLRVRGKRLREAGLDLTKAQCKYMGLCVPFGLRLGGSTPRRRCRKMHLCPWCWGRGVAAVVLAGLRRAYGPRQGDRYDGRLVVCRRRCRLAPDTSPAEALLLAEALLDADVACLRRLHAPGAVLLATVAPKSLPGAHAGLVTEFGPDAKPTSPAPGLHLRWGWAAVWPSGLLRPAVLDGPWRGVHSVLNPTPHVLAKEAGVLAAYPRGLWYGDPAQAARLLNARGEHRLLRTLGSCRKKKEVS